MTRVEKFHSYREEIANMKVINNSEKRITSEKIENIRKNKFNSKLNYEEIIDVYNLKNSKKKKVRYRLSKYQILYLTIGFLIILLLVVLIII